jgi:tryptophan-rich sensory protein
VRFSFLSSCAARESAASECDERRNAIVPAQSRTLPGSAKGANWTGLAGWLGLSLAAGAIGGIASANAREFYATLAKPAWAPPEWLFGPVWTALYILMGIAAWLVWRERPAQPELQNARRAGLTLFVAQLALNALWTYLFFVWRQGTWAFAEILVLWIAIAVTAALFGRISKAAAWCLVPYLAWVGFATALTWSVWRANPGVL